jgi:hypothetical protein
MGQRQKRMDGDTFVPAKILSLPSIAGPHTDDEYQEPKPGWFKRRFRDIGVLTMGTSTSTPELRLNVATVGMWIAIILAISGGFWFAYQRGVETGAEREHNALIQAQDAKEKEMLQQQIDDLKRINEQKKLINKANDEMKEQNK